MRKIVLLLILAISFYVEADPVNYCGEVSRIRVWAQGGDTYGIWVEYESNPEACPGGFYFPHEASNKEFLYSLILASKAANQEICIQTYPESADWKISGRCKINYAMHR